MIAAVLAVQRRSVTSARNPTHARSDHPFRGPAARTAALAGARVSPDDRWVAFMVDATGREEVD